MNKIFSLIIFFSYTFFIGSLNSNAQSTSTNKDQIHFGIQLGFQLQNINGTNFNNDKINYNLIPAYNAGISIEIPIVPEYYFQTGLLYNLKGATGNEQILGISMKRTLKINYIELPLHFLYKPLLGKGHLNLGIGPYISLGIHGKDKYEGLGNSIIQDVKFKNTVSLSDLGNYTYIRPLDGGADIIAGYELSNRISININAQLGLLKLNPKYESNNDSNTSIKHTGFGISVSYLIL